MGLCKCPKKKVTSQFCFEHKVNVCEHCMVSSHSTCIVGPYLQWLEDSSYQSNCTLCQQNLSSQECVRLICYHIFHTKCLNKYASEFPPNTQSAGYTCPSCQRSMFSSSTTSPVAQAFQKTLGSESWARNGFGLPLVDSSNSMNELNSVISNSIPNNNQFNVPQVIHHNPTTPTSNVPIAVNNITNYISSNNDHNVPFALAKIARESVSRRPLLDIDEDKYRNKSPMEFLSRWLRSHSTFVNRRNIPKLTYRRWIILGVILFILLCTVIHYFLKMGRESAEHDRMLDPHFNPNIRNEDD